MEEKNKKEVIRNLKEQILFLNHQVEKKKEIIKELERVENIIKNQ